MRRTASLGLLALVGACHDRPPDPRTLDPLVAVATVGTDDAATSRFTGVVRARFESDLGFRVGGKLAARLVDAGQTVRRGQPLARLDPGDLALGAAAQAADVAGLRARATQADADLKRLAGLVEQGAVSAQSYDQARTARDAARAQLAAAQAQARVAGNARGYAVLVADADGVVQATTAEPGQVLSAGQTVVRLAHAGPREAVAALPETLRPPLGSVATATLFTGGPPFPARLRQLSQSADPATRTFEARYVLEGGGADAALGSTVTLALPNHAGGDGAVEVPLGAVYDPGGGPGVWRVAGGRVRFQPVRLVRMGAEGVTLTGVPAGAVVVALGADRLRAGQAVRTRPLPGAGS